MLEKWMSVGASGSEEREMQKPDQIRRERCLKRNPVMLSCLSRDQISMWLILALTCGLFPNEWKTFLSVVDAVDVEAIQRSRLQVWHFNVGVLADGQSRLSLQRAWLIQGHHGNPVTWDISSRPWPGQDDFLIWDLIKLQICWWHHFLCGKRPKVLKCKMKNWIRTKITAISCVCVQMQMHYCFCNTSFMA